MSDTTKIQWADATFNPWIGCTKVSPGCKNCYAENTTRARVLRSQGHETWGKGAKRSRTSDALWKQAVRWNGQAICLKCGSAEFLGSDDCRSCGNNFNAMRRMRVFPSLCDWLDDEVPVEWLADFLKLIHDTPNLDWLLLTKRPENFFKRLDAIFHADISNRIMGKSDVWFMESLGAWYRGDNIPQNVWIGVSTENQEMADKRIPELLKIPAKVRFLSVEPMLGPIKLREHLLSLDIPMPALCQCGHGHGFTRCPNNGSVAEKCHWCGCPCKGFKKAITSETGIHWVIFGGESHPDRAQARHCHVDWIRDGVKQCKSAGVPVFVKQLGAKPVETTYSGNMMIRPENKRPFTNDLKLKDPKGGDMTEWPDDLRIREFPTKND